MPSPKSKVLNLNIRHFLFRKNTYFFEQVDPELRHKKLWDLLAGVDPATLNGDEVAVLSDSEAESAGDSDGEVLLSN